MSAEYCALAPGHPFHGPYHDGEYGFPARDDRVLFERLVLEINQAGLSWLTVLKKRQAFAAAFADWDIERVARFGARDEARLLADPGIIRNRLKIAATIGNAGRILALRDRHGSFAAWLDAHHPRSKPEWVRLFRDTFRFTGGEIVGEFLMSLGYLPGAHENSCPVQARILSLGPPWARVDAANAMPRTPPIQKPKRPVSTKNKARSYP
ncbi:MAG TPA: DNA-3-methyladenine glycosylase I [Stellaceae bacterium]|nr:DNA-3-methyladenine glycosylase I [Stellaceae bacterium]